MVRQAHHIVYQESNFWAICTNTLKMPSYYSPDIPYTCLTQTPAQQAKNLQDLVDGVVLQSVLNDQTVNAQNGLLIAGKYQEEYTSTQKPGILII